MEQHEGPFTTQYWKDRADEVLQKAEIMQDLEIKKAMLQLVEMYTFLAKRAARREQSPRP